MPVLLIFSFFLSFLIIAIYATVSYQRYLAKINKLPLTHELPFYALPLNKNIESKKLISAKVYLIHGTFALSAPLKDWVRVVEKRMPQLARFAFHFSKLIIDIIYSRASDMGIFTEEYKVKLNQKFNFDCSLFFWSGHNDHSERILAAVALIDQISRDAPDEENIVIMGHSHAGSIAALLTQIIYNQDFLPLLEKTLKETPLPFSKSYKEISEISRKIRLKKLIIITLGMAPRYHFFENPNITILNIIHSPKAFPFARHWLSSFWGPKGDLIQQWALSGSDTKSIFPDQRAANKNLDNILDSGNNIFIWNNELKKLNRISPHGKTILVEFSGGYGFINAIKSIMGHGPYTQVKYLEDLWQIIFKHLEQ